MPDELSGDKAKTDPADDEFGHAPFAKMLADAIEKATPPDGLVIALHGPWGSGKTTVLAFVRYYLQQLSEDDRPIVVPFNPWWFSGRKGLTAPFFEQLLSILRKWKSVGDSLVRGIAELAVAVSDSGLPFAQVGALAGMLTNEPDVQKIKERIGEELTKQGKQILVIVDDIDRLTANEVRELFKVIKAVGDLPRVVYLLAFDKVMVIKALESVQGIPGADYLEKIVQVPFELPPPDRTALRRFFFKRLDQIFAATPQETFDQVYWGNVFLEGIDRMLESPRDVVRFVNTLSITYPQTGEEVNPVDFIAIEAVRVFYPDVYDLIRRNGDQFVGGFDHAAKDGLQRFHDSWTNDFPDGHQLRLLLRRLFPKLDSLWGSGASYTFGWQALWRKKRRICSVDRFPAYFRFGVPEGDISVREWRAIIASLASATDLEERLAQLGRAIRPDGVTRLRVFLDQFLDYVGDVPEESIPEVILAFANVDGDHLDEQKNMWDERNESKISRIFLRLTPRLDATARLAALNRAFEQGRTLPTIMQWVVILGQQQGKHSERNPDAEDTWLVDAEGLKALESIVLGRIRRSAAKGTLLSTKGLPWILYLWKDLADLGEVKEWAMAAVLTDEGLLNFVASFLSHSFTQVIGDQVGRRKERLSAKAIGDFIDTHNAEVRLRAMHDIQNERHSTASALLLRGLERMSQGENPDHPLDDED